MVERNDEIQDFPHIISVITTFCCLRPKTRFLLWEASTKFFIPDNSNE